MNVIVVLRGVRPQALDVEFFTGHHHETSLGNASIPVDDSRGFEDQIGGTFEILTPLRFERLMTPAAKSDTIPETQSAARE